MLTDLRFAFRSLAKSRGFAFVAILTVALVLAALLSPLLARMLYGVAAFDPLTYGAVAAALAALAFLATWLPARRATQVDPIVALRSE